VAPVRPPVETSGRARRFSFIDDSDGAGSRPSRKETGMKTRRSGLLAIVGAVLVTVLLVAPASALQVGDKAPDFTLNGPDGKPVKLADLTAKGPVVIYTFIQAFTAT
jgi:hypothetical protein